MKHLILLLALIAGGCATTTGYQFALIGDAPYAPTDSAKFARLVQTLNAEKEISWVMHAGDIKSGASACTDSYLQSRFDFLQSIRHPLILTPGDNEWTDCHRNEDNGHAPLERLDALRALFFSEPGQTLGQSPMQVEFQAMLPAYSTFPENVRWEHQGVYYATMHLVGSQNGLAPFPGRTSADDDEVQARITAAVFWLSDTFDKAIADQSRGIFLMIHANPHFEARTDSPFDVFLTALEQALTRFKGPVWLAHGDTHYFRMDKPLIHTKRASRFVDFTRIETFGSPDVHWIRVRVDPDSRHVFSVIPEIIDANRNDLP